MVLTKEKLIFIHIPKTGGISIEEYLQSYYGYQRNALILNHGYGVYRDKYNSQFTIYPHMHFPLIELERELFKNNIIVDNSWKIFSIVRNPYNKFLSALFYSDKVDLKYHYFTLPENQRSHCLNYYIDQFLNLDINDNYISNHIAPQHLFFKETNLKYNIFKFEEGLENILVNLGYDAKGKLGHHLNTFKLMGVPRIRYEQIYTKHLIEVINELFVDDFKLFEYEMLSPSIYP